MCDYSLTQVKSRPAAVGERLRVHNFGTGTRGFAPADQQGIDCEAVCLLPGTELAFDDGISVYGAGHEGPVAARTARFRQINKEHLRMHHDALETPDGQVILLTYLCEGQMATVLQLPAAPKTVAEELDQRRVEYVG